MNSIIEMLKSLFINMWVEHILYFILIKKKEVGMTIREIGDYCIREDWDGELSLDIILQDDDDYYSESVKERLMEALKEGDCSCGICRR